MFALSCGGSTPTVPESSASAGGAVRGSVTSEKTSVGVPNLVVALIQNGQITRTAPTDAKGLFDFGATPAGAYVVRLTGFDLAGVNPRFTSFDPTSLDVHVASGSPSQLFFAAVGLIPPRIVGSVRCAGGPAVGVRLRIVGGVIDETVTTNDAGKYAATDLDAGHYAVIIESAPCAVAPMYGVAELKAGQAASLDFGG